ncbi:ankyrin repeat domain-containing protein [Pedobacter metabolipauper]|uniref:Ankyrin repeat protein n=1 Tax=Pedobacter metabolipauper TaxID=425513 RepID=A0A4R6SVU1_9SPHI|nr:ankyrin repeat domain-containing protein [Pedobacter metabolipauper]TDQ09486.1 ankyrin repeat protein [Pedobacter metabolipauper]
MNNDFNPIKDAYQRNIFASGADVIDVAGLYKSLPEINITNESDENLYHLATQFTDTWAIEFLKNAGLKPAADKYGNTPLHTLTTTKFDLGSPDLETNAVKIYDTAMLLLDLGINPKKKNDSGKLAYFEAGLLYMYPFIKAMGDAGVKMDATQDEGKNLLHTICDKLVHHKSITGAVEAATLTVRILIEKSSIDLEDKDIFNTTPLTYAQRSGVKEIAALLSGDETDTATGGMTIHEAVLNRDTIAVEALIKNGTDLDDFSDQYHRTPLMLSCEYPSAPMVTLLLDGGANVNFRSGNDDTAVHYLIGKAISNFGRGMSQDIKDVVLMLRTLIKHGLELDSAVNNESDTALNAVCRAGYLADLNALLAEELIEAGCDINKPNASGKTPLMSFAERGNEVKYSIIELLLDNDADTTYTDKNGNTALMYTAGNPDKMSGKKMISLILSQNTSTIDKVNNTGQTALDIAVKNDNEAAVKQLIEAMS